MRTDLDSRYNMVMFGKHCCIISSSGRYAEVNAFTPDLNALHRVPIVDAVIAYDCPYTMKTYIIVGHNILHVPSMDMNLIPPFILREAGVEIYDIPKIHVKELTVDDHSIYFNAADLRIPLSLYGYSHTL